MGATVGFLVGVLVGLTIGAIVVALALGLLIGACVEFTLVEFVVGVIGDFVGVAVFVELEFVATTGA